MFEGVQKGNSLTQILHSSLSAVAERASLMKRTQLIFVNQTPVYFGNRIINEQCIFFHPDGRITCVENPESALQYLANFNGEIYLPEHIVADEILLDPEA
jgi:hypothetical protein